VLIKYVAFYTLDILSLRSVPIGEGAAGRLSRCSHSSTASASWGPFFPSLSRLAIFTHRSLSSSANRADSFSFPLLFAGLEGIASLFFSSTTAELGPASC
jgi:hypothetical protein